MRISENTFQYSLHSCCQGTNDYTCSGNVRTLDRQMVLSLLMYDNNREKDIILTVVPRVGNKTNAYLVKIAIRIVTAASQRIDV